jgi:hypothetical protein
MPTAVAHETRTMRETIEVKVIALSIEVMSINHNDMRE